MDIEHFETKQNWDSFILKRSIRFNLTFQSIYILNFLETAKLKNIYKNEYYFDFVFSFNDKRYEFYFSEVMDDVELFEEDVEHGVNLIEYNELFSDATREEYDVLIEFLKEFAKLETGYIL